LVRERYLANDMHLSSFKGEGLAPTAAGFPTHKDPWKV
jgi:hypothetical protein